MLQKSVRDANKMVSRPTPKLFISWSAQSGGPRSVLLIALIQCLNGVWVLENPGSTLIHLHPAFQWLVEKMQALEIDVPCLDANACLDACLAAEMCVELRRSSRSST